MLDALTQLALMTKAKQVFEQDGTFLSFPVLTPFGYLPEQLAFSGPAADLRTLAEFSWIVNRPQHGPLYQQADGSYLWDLYADVFRAAEVAADDAAPEQLAAYQRAAAVLYMPTPDGLREDTPTYRVFKQHRDAVFAAKQELAAAAESERPALRQKLDEAETAWAVSGFRGEVEQAERVVRAFAERSSSSRLWEEWRDAFNPDIDTMTDAATNQQFAPTAFSPSDPFDEAWPTFPLSADEIAALVAQAPAELKDKLDLTGGAPPPERITFEFRSVGLTRPWLRKEVFGSRFWRLPPSEQPLSDGGNPPRGRCPAYITAVVFARNITEWRRPPAGGGPSRVPVRTLPALRLKAEFVRPPVSPPPPPPAVGAGVALRPGRFAAAAVARPAAMHTAAAVSPMMIARTRAAPVAAARARATSPLERLRGSTFTRIAFPLADRPGDAPTPTPTPTPADPTPSAPSREITLLAFICKPLPKCPDPDPALRWE